MTLSPQNAVSDKKSLRIALLHMAPRYDDLTDNLAMLERLIRYGSALGAELILAPELAVCGYEFYDKLGRDWIKEKGKAIIDQFCRITHENQVALVLGCPTYDAQLDTFHNSAIVIDEAGQVAGTCHKQLVLPGSIEGWCNAGTEIRPVGWRGSKMGLLICADAYQPRIAEELAKQGANVLISLAAWAPGDHAPNGEWEQCTQAAGLYLYVCNRTGKSLLLNFEGSSSVVVINGRRHMEYTDPRPAILVVDVNPQTWQPQSTAFEIVHSK